MSKKNKIGFYIIVICIVGTILLGCKNGGGDNNTVPEEYHLGILYGTVKEYTRNDGQWLNIYQAESNGPTPVYIWAHGNGHTYNDAHEKYEKFVQTLIKDGITVISWESIKEMDDSNYKTIMADAIIMFEWVKEHAEEYNIDLAKVVIGGHSRGSIASWELAQSGYSGIKGIYFGDAAGNLDDVNGDVNSSTNLITASSPPIRISYNKNKKDNDGQHDPNQGQKIIDIYREKGFINEDSMLLEDQGYPSMTELGFYSDLLSFCQYVIEK